jgi:hypothetical protein
MDRETMAALCFRIGNIDKAEKYQKMIEREEYRHLNTEKSESYKNNIYENKKEQVRGGRW